MEDGILRCQNTIHHTLLLPRQTKQNLRRHRQGPPLSTRGTITGPFYLKSCAKSQFLRSQTRSCRLFLCSSLSSTVLVYSIINALSSFGRLPHKTPVAVVKSLARLILGRKLSLEQNLPHCTSQTFQSSPSNFLPYTQTGIDTCTIYNSGFIYIGFLLLHRFATIVLVNDYYRYSSSLELNFRMRAACAFPISHKTLLASLPLAVQLPPNPFSTRMIASIIPALSEDRVQHRFAIPIDTSIISRSQGA